MEGAPQILHNLQGAFEVKRKGIRLGWLRQRMEGGTCEGLDFEESLYQSN